MSAAQVRGLLRRFREAHHGLSTKDSVAVGLGLADRHHLLFAEVLLAATAIEAGLLALVSGGDSSPPARIPTAAPVRPAIGDGQHERLEAFTHRRARHFRFGGLYGVLT